MTNASLLPWLVADIGGTNARFGLVRETGGDVGEVRSFRCADFASPEAAALAYLQQLAAPGLDRVRPARVALALATAIDGDSVQMTNSAWRVSRAAVAQALGAAEVVLLNDFEALALALPRLANADAVGAVQWIGPARPDRRHTMAVVGPGTGLGVAACVPAASRGAGLIAPQDKGSAGFTALPGEGGHATLAPADDF
ncbi:glucokinase, partial [Methylibium sp.]|uniref:glucokinase n=1 Tax=Methylibium sp. TaxID=2067992 RepID=UPI00286AD1B3